MSDRNEQAGIARREFLQRASDGLATAALALAASDSAIAAGDPARAEAVRSLPDRVKSGTPLGSLHSYLDALAKNSRFTHSFLHAAYSDLDAWKQTTRARLWELIPEKVDRCDFRAEVVESVDKGDYIREKVYFDSTPGTRVPAYVLIPKGAAHPVPGLVCFHDHGGMYYWGKEKIVELDDEHPALQNHKQRAYGGRSYATDFCRAGFAVIVIDAFYWGERRLISDADVEKGINDWRLVESPETIVQHNRQSGQNEDLVARSLYQLGHTWQGIWLRDEIRSLDYLLSRPEVDATRIGCVGLSIGGFRSAQFAGMEPRVRCAVVDGWMTTYGQMFDYKPLNTHYLQYITGAFALVDLPDLAALCCPGGLMVIHGRHDKLFRPEGVAEAYEKIQAVYRKAGVPENAALRYYDSPHEFNREMQTDALQWLKKWLA